MKKRSILELIQDERYRSVKGWLQPGAAQVIEAWAYLNFPDQSEPSHNWGSTLEIGVHHGKCFLVLENITPSAQSCYAYDLFDAQQLNIDKSGSGNLETFTLNVSDLAIKSERVHAVSGDSFSIRSKTLPHDYSLISIDGGHTREHTAFDLSYADETLRPGGLVVLDDFNNINWLGVMEGTLDYLSQANRRLAPFMAGFNKLFLTSISEAEVTRTNIEKSLADIAPNLRIKRLSRIRGHIVRGVV